MIKPVSKSGDRHGKIVLVSINRKDQYYNYYWNCTCDCGSTKVILVAALRSGKVTSCGCDFIPTTAMGGLSNHRLYHTWLDMNRRCNDRTRKDYLRYGGRGIRVCKRWSRKMKGKQGFLNFVEDMESTFKEGLSIERFDNNVGYNRHNCEWATAGQQAKNRRKMSSMNGNKTSSGFIGVSEYGFNGKFSAYLNIDKERIQEYGFNDERDAAIWRDTKIIEFGINAPLNILERNT